MWNNGDVDTDIYMGLVFVAYVTYSLQSTLNPIFYSIIANTWRKDMDSVVQNCKNKLIGFFRRVTGLCEVKETKV